MDMRIIPPLRIKSMLESNPLKSIMLVRRLAVPANLQFNPEGGRLVTGKQVAASCDISNIYIYIYNVIYIYIYR